MEKRLKIRGKPLERDSRFSRQTREVESKELTARKSLDNFERD